MTVLVLTTDNPVALEKLKKILALILPFVNLSHKNVLGMI